MKNTSIAILSVILIALNLLTGCSSSNPPSGSAASTVSTPAPAKPPSLYTGLQAFSSMNGLAQRWATDVIPVRLESLVNSEANGQDGKAAVWKAAFISPSRHVIKYFTCSGSRLPDAPPYGASAGTEEPYGSDVPALGFQPLFLKINSDQAYTTAQEHGGAALLKKNANQPVKYFVVWNTKQHALFWYVMYGADKDSAVGTGMVNALTGAYAGASK